MLKLYRSCSEHLFLISLSISLSHTENLEAANNEMDDSSSVNQILTKSTK